MTLPEFEIKRCEKLIAEFIERRRPPLRLRKDVDLAFRIKAQCVEIFEIRPSWTARGKPIERPIAKATYNKSNRTWKIFWQRADLKWHRYDPLPEVDAIEDYVNLRLLDSVLGRCSKWNRFSELPVTNAVSHA
jgi:Protein of unknown function (DUF3024)